MSTCLLDTGYKIGCNKLPAGIRKIYLTAGPNITSYTYATGGTISTITLTSGQYFNVEVKPQTTEFVEKMITDEKTGARYFETTLTINLLKNSYILRNLFIQLIGSKYSIIVLDNNNRYWLMGELNFCTTKESEKNAGKTYLDFNGNKITFIAKESQPNREVEATAFYVSTTTSTGGGGGSGPIN